MRILIVLEPSEDTRHPVLARHISSLWKIFPSPLISPQSYVSFKAWFKCPLFWEALLSPFPHEGVITPCSVFSGYFVYTAKDSTM